VLAWKSLFENEFLRAKKCLAQRQRSILPEPEDKLILVNVDEKYDKYRRQFLTLIVQYYLLNSVCPVKTFGEKVLCGPHSVHFHCFRFFLLQKEESNTTSRATTQQQQQATATI